MNKARTRYYRRQVDFFQLLQVIKLWPSRSGTLHGIKAFKQIGDYAEITTHCNKTIRIRNSKNSRAARWLRNKWSLDTCKLCGIPAWKIEKYGESVFTQNYGSALKKPQC